MIETILRFSIARRWLMMTMILALIGMGYWSYQKLAIDAVPDITNVQVQINTRALGYSPLESAQRITYPIETALTGIPHLSYTALYHGMAYHKLPPYLMKVLIYILLET